MLQHILFQQRQQIHSAEHQHVILVKPVSHHNTRADQDKEIIAPDMQPRTVKDAGRAPGYQLQQNDDSPVKHERMVLKAHAQIAVEKFPHGSRPSASRAVQPGQGMEGAGHSDAQQFFYKAKDLMNHFRLCPDQSAKSNASWTVLMARFTSSSAMSTVILISDVAIILILTLAL